MKKYIDEHAQEILDDDKKKEQQMLSEQRMSLTGLIERMTGEVPVPPPTPASAAQDDKKTEESK